MLFIEGQTLRQTFRRVQMLCGGLLSPYQPWVMATLSSHDGWQIVAVLIIICGVGIFGMISGLITFLTAPTRQQDNRSKNKEKLLEQVLDKQEQI